MPETAVNTPSSQDSRISERTDDTVREGGASSSLVDKDQNPEVGHKSDRCAEPRPQDTQPTEEVASQETTEVPSLPTPSAPSSPSYGTTSITTLPKDDDVFATPNGSSESTWEKISQTSQNGERALDKTNEDDDDAKISAWEHVPAFAQLKEAPPPAFNIWQKRALDAQAKAKPVQSTGSASPPNKEAVHSSGSKKALEQVVDTNKVDKRRKSIAGIRPSDEKAGSVSVKESARPGEGKLRKCGRIFCIMPDLWESKLTIWQKESPTRLLVHLSCHDLLSPQLLHLQEILSPGLLQILLRKRRRKGTKTEVTKERRRSHPPQNLMVKRNG